SGGALPPAAGRAPLDRYGPIHAGRAADVRLVRVALADDACVGTPGEAADASERAIGFGLLALAAEALRAMDDAKAHTLEYLR
ncbi:pimeloyl-CoA dehydrogenase small subunit, partial [Burkholderia pseudomallei]